MIIFIGDICYSDSFFDVGFGIGSMLKKGINPFQKVHFNDNDYIVGNFECVCSNQSNKKLIERDYFRISPEFLSISNKINLYGTANNHIMQHGPEAYLDTLNYIESKSSSYVGSFNKKSHIFSHNGYSVGILNFSYRPDNFSSNPLYWYIPDHFDIEAEYSKIKNLDLRIAYIHWGYEYMNFPSMDQRLIGRYLIDLGFSLVVGLHSHVLQGYEKYKGGYIFYSLGNFLFNMEHENCKRSVILSVDLNFNKELVIDYDYVLLDKFGFPEIQDIQDVPENYKFEYLNKLLCNMSNEQYFSKVYRSIKSYRKKNYLFILKSIHRYNFIDIIQIFSGFIRRRLSK